MSPTKRLLGVIALSAAAAVLTGCSLIGNILPGNDEGAVEGKGDQADVFTLKVGDCLNDAAADDEVTSVPLVECSEPHDSEIYGRSEVADGDYPGETPISDQAETDCNAQFTTFVGLTYDESVLDFSYYYPTSDSWDTGDREILCVIYDADDNDAIVPITGTLAGANR